MSTLFIVDAIDLAFSCYRSLKGAKGFKNSQLPMQAVFGGAVVIQKIISKYAPDYLAFVSGEHCADVGDVTDIGNIEGTSDLPVDFRQQLPYFYRLLESYGLPLIAIEGIRVVDIVGSLAFRNSALYQQATIVSSNSLYCQLVGDRVRFLYTKDVNVERLLDADAVKEIVGVFPDRVVDLFSLSGSCANNISGLPGISGGHAVALIRQYGSIDGIFKNINKIPSKRSRKILEENMDAAWISHNLLTISTEIDLAFPVRRAEVKPSSLANHELLDFFTGMGLGRQAALVERRMNRLATDAGDSQASPEAVCSEAQQGATGAMTIGDWLASPLSGATVAVHPFFSHPSDDHRLAALVIQVEGSGCQLLSWPQDNEKDHAVQLLEKLCEQKLVIVHDLKRLLKFAALHGSPLEQPRDFLPFFDVGIADYLLDPNSKRNSLDCLFSCYLGDHSRILVSLTKDCFSVSLKKPLAVIDSRLPRLTRQLLELAEILTPKLLNQGLDRLMGDLEIPLTFVLAKMESTGIFIDTKLLADYSDALADQLAETETLIYKLAGEKFNINSPKQVQAILFEKLDIANEQGVSNLKRVASGYSTEDSQLRVLSGHPLPRAILDYRAIFRAKSTYVDALPRHVNAVTGRIHTRFNQVMAATGRLSSENPNLQNIPKRAPVGRRIRKAFRSEKSGWQIVTADYSQVELRLLAELSGEDKLAAAFAEGLDIHASTAQRIFKLPLLTDVSPEQRSRAKAVNFGILYGMGARRLAVENGVSVEEAEDFIVRYFETFSNIKGYTEELVDRARKCGYAETMLGRRRPIIGLSDRNTSIRSKAENTVLNTTIQGSAADLIKAAMVKLSRVFKDENFEINMLLQVHDELVFSSPSAEVDPAIHVIRRVMESAVTTIVPMTVDIRSGPNWLAVR